MFRILHVVGSSGSGKTVTIEYLTANLARLGFHIGVIKHIHKGGLTFDTEGKDTWRVAKAGAKIVIGVSPTELAIFKKTSSETQLQETLALMRREAIDLVLIEGYIAASCGLKIITARNKKDLRYALARGGSHVLAITGPIASKRMPNAPAPIIDIGYEGVRLTSMIRRLLRPEELGEWMRRASLRHGHSCAGLAIGTRAAHLASSAFNGLTTQSVVTFGTKNCISEAFLTIFPKVRLGPHTNNDEIVIRQQDQQLLIKVATKKTPKSPMRVLKLPDDKLFETVRLGMLNH